MALFDGLIAEELIGGFPLLKKWEKVEYLKEAERENLLSEDFISRKGFEDPLKKMPSIVSLKTRRAAADLMNETIESVRMGKALEAEPVKKMAISLVKEILANHQKAMLRLVQIKTYDDYTFTHSVNVAIISALIGIELKLSHEELEELTLGGLLHDIGKIKIDRKFLLKPGPLNREEFEKIKGHPEDGFEMVLAESEIGHIARMAIKQHHERQDGSGYPKGLKGNEINDCAAIVSVADIYDALSTERPYRRKLVPYEAVKTILMMTGQRGLKEEMVRAFLSVLSIYPQGSLVRLNTGETAMVIRVNKESIIRPVIKLLLDSSNCVFKDDVKVNLLTQPYRYITSYVSDDILPDGVLIKCLRLRMQPPGVTPFLSRNG